MTTPREEGPTVEGVFIGQHGLRRKIFNTTTALNFGILNGATQHLEILATDLEAQKNYKDGHYGNVFSGYFKAPATAEYRFYMACDDSCQLSFSKVSMDPSQADIVLTVSSYTSYRSYATTSWMSLTKDEYYFMEVKHVQGGGGDHLTVSVEIHDPTITPGHQHTVKEIQRLQIN